MITLIGEWIRKIALFVIFSALIEILMPESHFRKYIHMILGFVLMLMLIRPITYIFFDNKDTFINLVEINQLEMERQSIARQSSIIESKQEELILDTYKSNLGEQIEKLIESNTNVDVGNIKLYVNEDKSDKSYGILQKVELTIIKNQETGSTTAEIEPIQPIKINIDHSDKENKKQTRKEDELEKNIKNLLISFYNLSGDNIHITVQKK
ncbi:MAG: stage sporulation protein [Epulopiscium sp.]|jgi:stage III sporulation protein AF|uniref:Stage III sporulation protein AF n=1 Tax=Defluviitalea raffinosedens TaxID=1450156 RepID=A0A7C8HJP5_9FIRM|nr:stage III sporulation protein AF [Defluviitalea raffinosedens]KAE9637231.1 stage III sporulation protein AF [Defluviitalea raffinosedens]MBM7685532.1 stage III sporulation protein AF [Defluviitalea raffinosedens]MDK2788698.1 stage sporulation protein [Candidatus Epulonipiscium sp.]HHW66739.1 stage III sporulation protein AF [Candidatus Epulonipiscium sp.]